MAKVVVYSKVPCPYCVHAKRFLTEKGVAFEEIDLTGKPDEIQAIKEKTGWMTVPIILINDQLIGGYNDLKDLDAEGKLDQLLNT
ncbi:MAG: glutaredoxin [Bdellovibrio sp. CG10_big_fil_rev_8_21_14_0_10_47_8]|nr:MAG: glutaredoxin [Bdellovibrio sp. CG10_big_fil_rev_8_21_14_0_10_47_8]